MSFLRNSETLLLNIFLFCKDFFTNIEEQPLFLEFCKNGKRIHLFRGLLVEFRFKLENFAVLTGKVVDNQGDLLHCDFRQIDFAVNNNVGNLVVKFKLHFPQILGRQLRVIIDFKFGLIGFGKVSAK